MKPREGLPQSDAEQREKPSYSITIVVHRHGPKKSVAGELSEQGKEEVAAYFEDAYENVASALPEGQGVDQFHSPIKRVEQTAALQKEHSGQKIDSTQVDERLSEGTIAEHPEILEQYGGRGGQWMSKWAQEKERRHPDVKTGAEASQQFAEFLLEKIHNRQTAGGQQEIDALANGPAMLSFMAGLENRLGIQILPKNWQNQTDFNKIINFLEYFNLWSDSGNPDVVHLYFKRQKFELPLTVLEEMAQK